MISDIRAYLKAQIRKVDSDLKENKSAFYHGNIGENILDSSYQIEINNISNFLRDAYREDTIQIMISIFGYGYQDEIEKYDDLLEKSLCIRDHIIDLKNFSQVGKITNITSEQIASSRLPSDNNGFKIDINFTLTQAYESEV